MNMLNLGTEIAVLTKQYIHRFIFLNLVPKKPFKAAKLIPINTHLTMRHYQNVGKTFTHRTIPTLLS